ncbi:MAG TPA: hypothetical protein VMG55_09565 [Stellaceae bacterium]|nr:hypothetical protein [Stellaceae bacterium]
MTLPDFYELCEYWKEHPPMHLMVAAYAGIGKTSPRSTGDLGDLLRMMGPGGELRG